ncbi:MAG: HEAT repeat domain-containing protein [Acidobacteriota bacterium]
MADRSNGVREAQTRGTAAPEAAAPASLEAILKELASYDGGIASDAVWRLRDYVHARKDDPAARAECEASLLKFLKTKATPSAKLAASRHLRVIAGEAAVPALAAMLADERIADLALYALQPIPGQLAERALIQAVRATHGPTRIAVVAALGERRAAAVSALAPLLNEPAAASAAAVALGRIGGDEAARALAAAYPHAAGSLKATFAAAILTAAEAMIATENASGAKPLYEMVASDAALPAPIRAAAVRGRISAAGDDAASLLLETLAHADPPIQEAAIAKIADVFRPDAIEPVCALLPGLPAGTQVQVLAVLSDYPGDLVRPAVLQAAQSGEPPVRLAAMAALGAAGDHSVVPFLIDAAARTSGAEQAAARLTIARLKGRAVDDALLHLLDEQPAPALVGEVLLAVGGRRIFPAKPIVAGFVKSPVPAIRMQAMKALRTVGTPSDVPAMLDALVGAETEAERREAEKTATDLARMAAAAEGRARAIRARLARAEESGTRVRLIALLPLVGDPGSLPALRGALSDADPDVVDAAVRAIVAWPTTDARDDIIALARDSRNETHRLLAIGGLVRVVGLDRHRHPEAAVADLRLAAELSWRPEEQKLVLGVLVQFPCREALDLAAGFAREAPTRAEAQAAIEKIKDRLLKEAIRQ